MAWFPGGFVGLVPWGMGWVARGEGRGLAASGFGIWDTGRVLPGRLMFFSGTGAAVRASRLRIGAISKGPLVCAERTPTGRRS